MELLLFVLNYLKQMIRIRIRNYNEVYQKKCVCEIARK